MLDKFQALMIKLFRRTALIKACSEGSQLCDDASGRMDSLYDHLSGIFWRSINLVMIRVEEKSNRAAVTQQVDPTAHTNQSESHSTSFFPRPSPVLLNSRPD